MIKIIFDPNTSIARAKNKSTVKLTAFLFLLLKFSSKGSFYEILRVLEPQESRVGKKRIFEVSALASFFSVSAVISNESFQKNFAGKFQVFPLASLFFFM